MAERVQYADVNGLRLAYETFGDPRKPAVVLVMGLGTQMIAWPDEFCEALAARGSYVVRYDNRDVGLSTSLRDVPTPHPLAVMAGRRKPAYRIADMAEDCVGLLDALGLDRVDLVGASMGGFIAQTVALAHPERVRSLTLVMTSTGSRRVGRYRLHLARTLLRPRSYPTREAAVEARVAIARLIGSPGYPPDEAYVRDLASRAYDRAGDPKGYLRHLGAIAAQPDRTRALRRLRVPTLIMHGLHDPLVNVSGGIALGRAIQGARFLGFPGMGHDLPRALWPQFAAEITAIAEVGRARDAERSGRPAQPSGGDAESSGEPAGERVPA